MINHLDTALIYKYIYLYIPVSQVSQASSLGQAGAASGSVKPVAAVLRTKSGKIILPASMLPPSMLRASKPGERIQEQDTHIWSRTLV